GRRRPRQGEGDPPPDEDQQGAGDRAANHRWRQGGDAALRALLGGGVEGFPDREIPRRVRGRARRRLRPPPDARRGEGARRVLREPEGAPDPREDAGDRCGIGRDRPGVLRQGPPADHREEPRRSSRALKALEPVARTGLLEDRRLQQQAPESLPAPLDRFGRRAIQPAGISLPRRITWTSKASRWWAPGRWARGSPRWRPRPGFESFSSTSARRTRARRTRRSGSSCSGRWRRAESRRRSERPSSAESPPLARSTLHAAWTWPWRR